MTSALNVKNYQRKYIFEHRFLFSKGWFNHLNVYVRLELSLGDNSHLTVQKIISYPLWRHSFVRPRRQRNPSWNAQKIIMHFCGTNSRCIPHKRLVCFCANPHEEQQQQSSSLNAQSANIQWKELLFTPTRRDPCPSGRGRSRPLDCVFHSTRKTSPTIVPSRPHGAACRRVAERTDPCARSIIAPSAPGWGASRALESEKVKIVEMRSVYCFLSTYRVHVGEQHVSDLIVVVVEEGSEQSIAGLVEKHTQL